mmetsp:Transcript_4088/g.5633  ORF Transcript_4088/g.5633 Transcript_4088/m.5633 type:complete len:144 (-) Transcript_4088:75-506(-)
MTLPKRSKDGSIMIPSTSSASSAASAASEAAPWIHSFTKGMDITWSGMNSNNELEVHMSIYMPPPSPPSPPHPSSNNQQEKMKIHQRKPQQSQAQQPTQRHHFDDEISSSQVFCQSIMYGTPFSWKYEPISICAPSLLQFFPL